VTLSETIALVDLGLAKYDGIRGQEILEIEEGENEVTIILRDNRYLFVKIVDGKLVTNSVPE
jgi:hypothetical protein